VSPLYTAADKLYTRRRRPDQHGDVERHQCIGSVAVSPDSKWVAFASRIALRSHVYIVPIAPRARLSEQCRGHV
jgi:hypothetical protein